MVDDGRGRRMVVVLEMPPEDCPPPTRLPALASEMGKVDW